MVYLFDNWKKIAETIAGKSLFIFLDFDGTLAPIVAIPEKAVLPSGMRELLERMSGKPGLVLAFISGRTLKDIKNKIGLKNVIYSGNHGLEMEGPNIKFESFIPLRYKTIIRQIKNDLERKVSFVKGALVEDKGLSLSLHYRLVERKEVPLLKSIFHETVTPYLISNKIKIKPGKMVLEVRPPVQWDKGRIVLWLFARQVFASAKEDTLPVYIGDDTSDEDAFKVLKNKGLTIFVGKPKKSYAEYYLRNPAEVGDFLRRIA